MMSSEFSCREMFEEECEQESMVDREVLKSPTRNREFCQWYSIPGHDERFFVSESVEGSDFSPQGVASFRALISILDDRFFLAALHRKPIDQDDVHFIGVNKRMRYVPFAADFGPPNLAATMMFCEEVQRFLVEEPSKKLVFYTSPKPEDLTNSIFLCGAFMVVVLRVSPAEALKPFANVPRDVCLNYRDATWDPVSFELSLTSCWAGLERAIQRGVFKPASFDPEEYLHYDNHGNGNLNHVVEGKFVAFKSPREKRAKNSDGTLSHTPADYINVLKSMNVEDIIRLNGYSYDPRDFVNAGFRHHDINYNARATPSDATIDRFLTITESSSSVTAVHCSAGLGRTQTLIGLFLMKAYRFTAEESIGWLRIARPGSIIGPQQHFLKSQESRLWDLGRKGVLGLGLAFANCLSPTQRLPSSAAVFDEVPLVRQGARGPKFGRCISSPSVASNFKIVIRQEDVTLSRSSNSSFVSHAFSSSFKRERARQTDAAKKTEGQEEKNEERSVKVLEEGKNAEQTGAMANEQWKDEFEKLLLGENVPCSLGDPPAQTSSSSSSSGRSPHHGFSNPSETASKEPPTSQQEEGQAEEKPSGLKPQPLVGGAEELPDKLQWQEEFEKLLLGQELEPLALGQDAAEQEVFFDLQDTFGRGQEPRRREDKLQSSSNSDEEGREVEAARYAEEVASLRFHAVSGRCISPELKPSCMIHSPEPFDFRDRDRGMDMEVLSKAAAPPPLLLPPLIRRPPSSSARPSSHGTRTTAFEIRRMKGNGMLVPSSRRSKSPQGRVSYPPYEASAPCRRAQVL